jgi:exodeoxyribonuclease III
MMKIATWNVNSLRVRLPQLQEWVEANPVDVLALQETKLIDADFPAAQLAAIGYRSVFSGQKTYNGVAILSRHAIETPVTDLPDFADPQRRLLAATVGGIRIVDVYVPNGQTVGSDKYAYKLAWLKALRNYLQAEIAAHPQLLLLGDFNVAPEDRDVHDPKSWEGSVLVSDAERAAVVEIQGLGLADLFRKFDQPPETFSWWDYRQGAYRRNNGLRIDLILGTDAMHRSCVSCGIDREPRTWERPSDHAPCVANFDISV